MPTQITVHPGKAISRINPFIYGHFIEHLGRCIMGGIYEEGSPLSDERGFRLDVLEAARRIKVPLLRWPGGNFASGYHWMDGIGPKDERPRRLDYAWRATEPNRFGTHEFIEYCRELGAEPVICVNCGSGTPEEAARWVEYCNYDGDTEMTRLRIQNGSPAPFAVTWWDIGNEMYGAWQIGHLRAAEYTDLAIEFSKLMRRADRNVKLIAVGDSRDPDWNLELCKRAGDCFDLLSVHEYHDSDDYYQTVAAADLIEAHLRLWIEVTDVAMEYLRREEPIGLAFDEWNVWYRKRDRHEEGEERTYELKDGLFACGVFHAMHRLCERVTQANLAQLVNVIGAMNTTPDQLVLTPIYHAFDLYVNHFGVRAVEVETQGDEFYVEYGQQGKLRPRKLRCRYLDASAALSEDASKLHLAVVNRHETQDIQAQVDLGLQPEPTASRYCLNAASPLSKNTRDKPEEVVLTSDEVSLPGRTVSLTFPAHSATILTVRRGNS